jgi:hypothetical protein
MLTLSLASSISRDFFLKLGRLAAQLRDPITASTVNRRNFNQLKSSSKLQVADSSDKVFPFLKILVASESNSISSTLYATPYQMTR